LPEPRPNLEAAVGAQLKAEGRELEKLRRIEQEVDTRIGSHERARIMQLMGAVFAAVYVTLATLSHSGIFDAAHGTMYAINLLYGVALGVATWMFRDTLRANRVNRRFAVGMGIPFAVPVLYWPVAMWKGVPFAEAIGVIELIYFMSSALIAAAIDFRLLWPAAIYLVAFVINAALPEYCYEILAAATLAALGLAANMIRHPSRTAPKNRASLPSMPG
ncbi:MAG: hypothetical protein KC620_06310, partial [Myxococcales bacterium]|nr:hypothetical protein [Myxococcales bacterium]